MGLVMWGTALSGNGLQKIAFVLLFALLMGVTTGWLGGL